MITCDECDCSFEVIWSNSIHAQIVGGPGFCPFCGSEVDYSKRDNEEK